MAYPHNLINAVACLAAWLSVVVSPSVVQADPPAAQQTRARDLRDRARQAMESDELPEARAALVSLQAIEPSADTTCNLGLVERRLGFKLEAVENLTRCVESFTTPPTKPEEKFRYDQLVVEQLMARAVVATLTLQAPPKAAVKIDGHAVKLSTPGREYFVLPGWHVIRVGSEERRLYLKEGSKTSLKFEAPPSLAKDLIRS
jgi:hypothetical protein